MKPFKNILLIPLHVIDTQLFAFFSSRPDGTVRMLLKNCFNLRIKYIQIILTYVS